MWGTPLCLWVLFLIPDNVISITYSIGEWGDDKSAAEREQFEHYMQQWADDNPYKAERIEDYHRKHRDEIPK